MADRRPPLMGFLFGRSIFVEGLIAENMYRLLRIMHDRALGGTTRAMLGVVVRALTRRTGDRPRRPRALTLNGFSSTARSARPHTVRAHSALPRFRSLHPAGTQRSRFQSIPPGISDNAAAHRMLPR